MDDRDVVRLRGTEVDVQFGEMVASNLPAVIIGAVELWPAISLWNPANSGLEYLKSLTGTTQIQAITSKSESVFYGHIKGHDRVKTIAVTLCMAAAKCDHVSLMFGSFIDLILSQSKTEQAAASPSSKVLPVGAECHLPKVTFSSGSVKDDSASTDSFNANKIAHNMELYLAQVPMYSREQEGETMLSPLMKDISTPSVLEGKEVWNINLWMSMKSSRSSTHYDPYHNILCVVAGAKRVTLWPPSAAPLLYPLPIHGEASNHSGVDIFAPDYGAHPLFSKALKNSKVATLQPGDALFIPEGWYHQVDNVGVTMAVNFWWPSMISLSLGSQMDGYILRRVVSSLLDREKKLMLEDGMASVTDQREGQSTESKFFNFPGKEVKLLTDSSQDQYPKVHKKVEDVEDLTVEEALHLRTLVMSAMSRTSMSPAPDSKLLKTRKDTRRSHQIEDDNVEVQWTHQKSVIFQEDPLCKVFATVGALSLQRVLLVMATQFPQSLRVLVMEMLSPAAAELLTMKFEELDGSLETTLQAEFYEKFYSVFESPEAVMASLLEKKEAFSAQALGNVMSQFLGLSCRATNT